MTSPTERTTGPDDAAFVYAAWHELAVARDVPGLLDLYVADAVLESPLAIPLLGKDTGVVQGRHELREFLDRGTNRRPSALVRFWRTGDYCFDGRTLFWEYPRSTPYGEQLDLAEVMELRGPKIAVHRIYWGWRGLRLLDESSGGPDTGHI